MKSFDKESFLLLLKIRPQWLMGKKIIYNNKTVGIVDISVSGDYLHIESSSSATEWVPASSLGDSIVVDIIGFPTDTGKDPFTVLSITRWIDSLQKYVGQPDSEHPKPLFEIVEALNKEVFELGKKVDRHVTELDGIRDLVKLYNRQYADLKQKIEKLESVEVKE